MKDAYGRNITYLRLSLTERCNLHCIYCRDGPQEPSSRELTPGEIDRIIGAMVSLGINKVRLTGGEPLMREDLEEVVGIFRRHRDVRDLSMTTNAQGLRSRARALKEAGLMRLNISLDSLRPDRYREITRGGDLGEVLAGIEAAADCGLGPIKLNCVTIRGKNDDEIDDFIALAREKPVDVRFIELMPMGASLPDDLRIRSREILDARSDLHRINSAYYGEPAETYTGTAYKGTVGFISPISRRFCKECNRIRVTGDGKLRPCLGDNTERDLREALLRGDGALRALIEDTVFHKPEGHHFKEGFVSQKTMNRIGG
ncbi:GTP 3',8-cyclase [Spirochaetia bacterium]|nr:GTP 3',8-cyclase [Spirochaetia bacterium]